MVKRILRGLWNLLLTRLACLTRTGVGRSLTFNTENAPAYYRRAFTFSAEQDGLAERDFRRAEKIYENLFALTQKYHSLSDVVGSVPNEWSDALLNWGVSLEKLGDKEKAASVYEKALSVQPNTPNAHYNLAVIYWNRDWDKVVYHLRECLRLDRTTPWQMRSCPRRSTPSSILPGHTASMKRFWASFKHWVRPQNPEPPTDSGSLPARWAGTRRGMRYAAWRIKPRSGRFFVQVR